MEKQRHEKKKPCIAFTSADVVVFSIKNMTLGPLRFALCARPSPAVVAAFSLTPKAGSVQMGRNGSFVFYFRPPLSERCIGNLEALDGGKKAEEKCSKDKFREQSAASRQK